MTSINANNSIYKRQSRQESVNSYLTKSTSLALPQDYGGVGRISNNYLTRNNSKDGDASLSRGMNTVSVSSARRNKNGDAMSSSSRQQIKSARNHGAALSPTGMPSVGVQNEFMKKLSMGVLATSNASSQNYLGLAQT